MDIFVYGNFQLVDESNDKVFAYSRRADNGETALIVCNFSADSVAWKLPGEARKVLVSPAGRTLDDLNSGEIKLAPCEAFAVLSK
jgi:hypothetical protein